MFPLEASGKPSRDYPRIGPSFCTKWFEPSILPGPVLPSRTRSLPCSIDAGGNIFQKGGGINVRNQEGAHTNKAGNNRPPSVGGGESKKRASHLSPTVVVRRRKCRARGIPNTGTRGNGCDSRIDTTGGGCQGASVLRHAGSILQCRSVYASSRTPPVRNSSSPVTGKIGTAATAPAKPMLRAYSAPQFLHSTSFPPVSPTHSTCGSMSVWAAGADNSRGRRNQTLTTGAGDGRMSSRRYQASATGASGDGRTSRTNPTPTTRADDRRTSRRCKTPAASNGSRGRCAQMSNGDTLRQENNITSAVAVAPAAVAVAGARARARARAGAGTGAGPGMEAGVAEMGGGVAPCRHRRAGYLHRYMGFVQERVSSPPLESFRALGGLRDYARKENRVAIVRRASIDRDGAASANPATEEAATSGPGRRGRRFSLGTNSERSCGGRLSSAAAVGGPSGTAVSQQEACPLELFADGSSLAPISPPNAAQVIPAWCSRSKKRPKGAKRQKSWEADGRRGGAHPKDAPTNKPPGSSSLKACKSKTRRNRRAGSPYLAGVPLPYDLERPVSPERAEAFRYTCN